MDFDLTRATALALIQGVTEFLPISSSAHLLLPTTLLGWPDQGLAFDVAVHLGTLLAVLLYFRHDLLRILLACLRQVRGGGDSTDSRLGWCLVVASLPVLVCGLLLKDVVDSYLRSVTVLAVSTIVFGLVLWWADRSSIGSRGLAQLDWRTSVLIGLAQVLALIPGTSRSGITITAALFCQLDREAASRFSFLLSIPVIGGAAALLLLDLLQLEQVNWLELGYALAVAAVTAYFCIHYFLKAINALGFLPFVIYRLLLGVVLLCVAVF